MSVETWTINETGRPVPPCCKCASTDRVKKVGTPEGYKIPDPYGEPNDTRVVMWAWLCVGCRAARCRTTRTRQEEEEEEEVMRDT